LDSASQEKENKDIMLSDLTLWQTDIRAISPSLGGFGLRFFSEYHSAAYRASSLQCFSFLSQILSPEEVSYYKNELIPL
jgi:hypothetical protein